MNIFVSRRITRKQVKYGVDFLNDHPNLKSYFKISFIFRIKTSLNYYYFSLNILDISKVFLSSSWYDMSLKKIK